mmetsp:Transcript_6022/g.6718  ORF Transcript_6022/g.6718 Transcript_6022/m.6718 type:complete len:247 (-) Transcript_6022:61-801(-)
MCVHPFDDIVSNTIRKNGHWNDCHILSRHWDAAVGSVGSESVPTSIFVDIGGNIGSCIMEMLFSANAAIIAFEPNPKNLFPMRETISRLHKSYQARVVVFPIALGSVESSNIIAAANNNMGNSQVGSTVKDLDVEGQKFDEKDKFEIKVERLDDILKPGPEISLVKMDAQGYECKILEGMGKDLASKIKHVHFEKADLFLNAHDCNDLLPRFRDYGFDIYEENDRLIKPEEDYNQMTYDLDAKKPK